MTWEEAVLEMARKYWNSEDYDSSESFKNSKYNKKYFDGVRDGMISPKDQKIEKKGKS